MLKNWSDILCSFSLLVCTTVFLSACQTNPVQGPTTHSTIWLNDDSVFAARRIEYSDMQDWKYSAKVGVTTKSGNDQANMIWRYEEQTNHLRLYGPLGAGTVKIDFNQEFVHLSDNKGVLHQGTSAQTLLSKITGWQIPIDALPYWLFVLPAPDMAYAYQLDEQGNIKSLRQFGWLINFSDYRNYGGKFLPRKLTAIHDSIVNNGAVNSETESKVKIISKSWKW